MSIIKQLKRLIPKSKLQQTEDAILAKREEGATDGESFGNSANVRWGKREADIKALEAKKSILDRRNSWKQKVLWNILVPIVVSIITAYVFNLFVGKQ